ncbi:MAG: nucleotide exchange factor GrpE [Halorhodospira sp.]
MTENQRQRTSDEQPAARDDASAPEQGAQTPAAAETPGQEGAQQARETDEAREAGTVLEGELESGDEQQPGAAEQAAGAEAVGEAEPRDPQALHARIQELESALADAGRKAQENWDQVLRMRAELENAQRRAQKDVEQAKLQAREKVLGDLLQVKDSLEMGVQAAEDAEADREKLLEGTQLTLKMLNQVFERFEIEELNPQGERFNPDYHEAMAMQPSDQQEPNTVLQVVQKGYRLQERLLRPALVVVAKKGQDGSGNDASSGSVDETV